MKKENTINETEARQIVWEALKADGVEITKTLLDKVMDKQIDLAIEGLKKGMGIKMQGLGTLEVRTHEARTYKVPNGDGTFKTVNKPAGKHVAINLSDKLYEEINKVL